MPLYEYQCECGAGVELSRPIAERRDQVLCESCGCSMELVPSLGGFSLKGGGWTPKGSFVPTTPRKPRSKGYDMTEPREGRDE